MIVMATDFGAGGPYVGQMRAAALAALGEAAGRIPIVELISDLAPFDARAAAYLLPAYAPDFPPGAVILAVVDPGVGGERPAVVLEAGGRLYVGPGNGLLEIARRRDPGARGWRIRWCPERLSASFHGRDLFAPVAARLAAGTLDRARDLEPLAAEALRAGPWRDWPDDLAEVVHVDRYGNALTGFRAARLGARPSVAAAGRALPRAGTFADRAEGTAFWYENANGLVEIAVARGRADTALGLEVGSPVAIEP